MKTYVVECTMWKRSGNKRFHTNTLRFFVRVQASDSWDAVNVAKRKDKRAAACNNFKVYTLAEARAEMRRLTALSHKIGALLGYGTNHDQRVRISQGQHLSRGVGP